MSEAREFLADGVRAERAGALDRALESYEVAANSSADAAVRSEALAHRADVYRAQCDWQRALAAAREALAIAEKAGLPQQAAEAVIAEANVLISQGEFAAAAPKLQHIATSSDDPRLRAIALQNLGCMHAQTGQARSAERAFRESLGNFPKANYTRGEAIALNNLGRLALDTNDAAGALPLLERALTLAREVDDSDLIALAGLNLASARCMDGDAEGAQDLATASLGYFAGCHNSWREIECLRLIGDIYRHRKDVENAARCYERALKLSTQLDSAMEVQTSRERLNRLSAR
jgi:tetratricopeptide (TPR) repeat protein